MSPAKETTSKEASGSSIRDPTPPSNRMATPGRTSSERTERVNRAAAALARGIDHDRNFRLIYESYYRPLQRFFARQGFSPEECHDLTQETFVGILKGMKSYRHQDCFQGWLYQLAKTTYLKQRRMAAAAKRSMQEVSQDDAPEAVAAMTSPAQQLDAVLDDERREQMRSAVRGLPKHMRQCATLHLYQGLSYSEIATVMKIKVNTVKAHMFQARKKLQDALRGFELGGLDGEAEERGR